MASGVLAQAVVAKLEACRWPGNVRELRNVIEGAVLMSEGASLTCAALSDIASSDIACSQPPATVVRSIAEGEAALIRRAIADSEGNLALAARQLRIAKSTLYVKMQRYGLSREAVRAAERSGP